MKKLLLIIIPLLLSTLLFSCKEDDDNSPLANFIGKWFMAETCQGPITTHNYTLTITENSSGDSDLLLNQLGQLGANTIVKANINGSGFTITDDPIPNTGGAVFVGTGSLSNGVLTITWSGGSNGSCTAIGQIQ